MKKSKFILIIILGLLIPITLFANTNVQATTDINFTFENDSFFNYTSPVYEDEFNVRDKTNYIGSNIFNGTYSFTDDNDYDNPTNWVINDETGGSINVFPTLDNHDKLLELNDTNANSLDIETIIDLSVSGTFEYWIQITSNTKLSYFVLMEGGSYRCQVFAKTGTWWVNDGAQQDTGLSAIVNIWYHFRIDFETGAGAYLGLAPDEYRVHINGKVFGDYTLHTAGNGINRIWIQTSGASAGYKTYYDAISYSWDSYYNIGYNLIGLINTTITNTTKEVDKWEFAYSDFPTQYVVGSDVFSDWTEIDTGDHVNIAIDYISLDGNPSYYPDRQIEIDDQVGSSADIGIQREFNVLEGVLNITWSLNFTVYNGNEAVNKPTMEVYSFDDTLIAKIYIRLGDICYYDGSEVIVQHNVIETGEIYDFNLYINSNHNLMVLSFSIDGVHYDNYIIPSLNPSKKGLGKIIFKNYRDPGREMIVYLDSIGVYSNGTSLSTEPAFRQIDLDDFLFHAYWYFPEYSLLYLNFTGFIGVYLTDWFFYTGSTFIEQLIPTRQFNGLGQIFNVAEQTHDGNDHIYTPKLWLEFYGQIQNSTEVRVNGIVLTDGSHDYIMTMTSANIRMNESYFYVVNNKLHYQIYFNDTNTEYIQLKFNVPNIYTDNYTNSFSSFQYGNGYGYFGYQFTDTTVQAFTFSTSYMRKSYYLTNHKTIDQLTILITDNDLFNTGNGYGYIDTITFTYLTNVSFTLTTLSLLSVLIVVILMFVPALLVSLRYNKKYLLPMLLLMTIVSYASALIPVWLMFIFIFGFIGILFIQKDEVKE